MRGGLRVGNLPLMRASDENRLVSLADAMFQGQSIQVAMRTVGYSDSMARRGQLKVNGRLIPPKEHPVVAQRLAELRATDHAPVPTVVVEPMARAVYSKRDGVADLLRITRKLETLGDQNEDAKALSAAGQTIERIAKLEGWIIDKKAIMTKRLDDMSDEELLAFIGEEP